MNEYECDARQKQASMPTGLRNADDARSPRPIISLHQSTIERLCFCTMRLPDDEPVAKISFWAPVYNAQTAQSRTRARYRTHPLTILEPALGVIRRTLVRAAQVEPAHLDIVVLRLVPDHDLFGALDTAALVVFAPHRGFGSTDRRRRFGIGYRAFKPFHVDVGLAASIRDLERSIDSDDPHMHRK